MVSLQVIHCLFESINKQLSFRAPEKGEGEDGRGEEEDPEEGDGEDRTRQDEEAEGQRGYTINVRLLSACVYKFQSWCHSQCSVLFYAREFNGMLC